MAKVLMRSAGARRLIKYLRSRNLSIQKFCRDNGLDRIHVQRVLKGEQGQRVTVDFARAILRATGGKVPWYSWRSGTLAPVQADGESAE